MSKKSRIFLKFSYGLIALPLLASCSIIPASGPYSADISKNASVILSEDKEQTDASASKKYALVKISQPIVNYLQNVEKFSNNYAWPMEENVPPNIKVNVGDTISLTIYEAQSGGLFIPNEAGSRSGNFINLPPQTIDKSGKITVPYIGSVEVAGKSPATISDIITKGLESRAIEPQVVVSIDNRASSEVSIIGQVKSATRFALNYNGDKILDAIAKAGGPDIPGYEAHVTLQRNEKEYTLPFDELVQDPEKNIYLHSGDTIYVYKEAKSFMVYGAPEVKGNYSFDKRNMVLSEALGKSNGLKDSQADPEEVYVYRYENYEDVRYIQHVTRSKILNSQQPTAQKTPVIYKFNLRQPDGFFLTQKFPMKDQDIVYIGNAKSVDFSKLLNLLGLMANTTDSSDRAYFNKR